MSEQKGFFASLFDFKVKSYVAPRILRALYDILVFILTIGAIIALIGGIIASLITIGDAPLRAIGGVLMFLIGVPIVYIIYLIVLRVWVEICIILFNMEDHLEQIANHFKPNREA